MSTPSFLKSRKFKHGSLAVGLIVAVIVVTILFNVVMSLIDRRVKFSVDMTPNSLFSLTNDSKEFLKGLDKDVEIVVLSSESDFVNQEGYDQYFKQANEVIKEYERASGKVKVTYKDVVKDPAYLSQFENENIHKGSIVVQSGDKHKTISANDLFEIQSASYQAEITASKAEQSLTSAILYVTSEGQAKVVFLNGYGEQDASGLENLLNMNNYKVEKTNLLSEDIPGDAAMAVVFAPSKDYDATGVDKLNKFLQNDGKYGKHLFVVADGDVKSYANLNSVLDKWGINIDSSLAFERDTRRIANQELREFGYVAGYTNNDYTNLLKNSSIMFFTPYAHAINVTDTNVAKPLLTLSSMSGVYVKQPEGGQSNYQMKANVAVAAVSEKKMADNAEMSKIFAFGSYVAFDSRILSQTIVSNSDYIINVFNAATGQAANVKIEPKSFESAELSVSEFSANTWGIVFCVILPLAILAAGISIICYRKYRK